MSTKPKYKLAPPHGERIYWQSTVRLDSRVEEFSADRNRFWRGMSQEASDGRQ